MFIVFPPSAYVWTLVDRSIDLLFTLWSVVYTNQCSTKCLQFSTRFANLYFYLTFCLYCIIKDYWHRAGCFPIFFSLLPLFALQIIALLSFFFLAKCYVPLDLASSVRFGTFAVHSIQSLDQKTKTRKSEPLFPSSGFDLTGFTIDDDDDSRIVT